MAFVTIIRFPSTRDMEDPLEKALLLQGVEHRFARLVRVVIVVIGVTGLYHFYAEGLYTMMPRLEGFWLGLMIADYGTSAP
ncbi:MAG: hypothetical protein R3231_03200 [bacterium]|nr:hypothetical protein [bacterium]